MVKDPCAYCGGTAHLRSEEAREKEGGEEPARFAVTIAAELASTRTPACCMTNVMTGRAGKFVRVAGEPESGGLSASQQAKSN